MKTIFSDNCVSKSFTTSRKATDVDVMNMVLDAMRFALCCGEKVAMPGGGWIQAIPNQ